MSDESLNGDGSDRRLGLMDSYNSMGPARFSTLIMLALAYVGAGMWLQHRIDWPDHYGFHCHGRTCLLENLSHSGALLQGHNFYELALFAWIWTIPAVAVGAIASPAFRRFIGARMTVAAKNEDTGQ